MYQVFNEKFITDFDLLSLSSVISTEKCNLKRQLSYKRRSVCPYVENTKSYSRFVPNITMPNSNEKLLSPPTPRTVRVFVHNEEPIPVVNINKDKKLPYVSGSILKSKPISTLKSNKKKYRNSYTKRKFLPKSNDTTLDNNLVAFCLDNFNKEISIDFSKQGGNNQNYEFEYIDYNELYEIMTEIERNQIIIRLKKIKITYQKKLRNVLKSITVRNSKMKDNYLNRISEIQKIIQIFLNE
ncbi:hypothetical protein A3Q56_03333 [Intoshia linei]|uniref:Uncharacterized protein n=1 Tax=Intoshia linei TaxID=1819745 RepID=A0A177B3R8_9BILA|nr:hypothetical protein A3Q56_03333 [Intoshia linei]